MSNPSFPTNLQVNIPKIPEFQLPTHHTNPARWTYEQLIKEIKRFEDALDDEHEIGVRLVSFGASITFHIIDMSYSGPYMITFDGIDDNGFKVQLHQHYTQLSVLLMAMNKIEETPRRIGFNLANKK